MQFDLLQEGLIPETKDKQTAPAKKEKPVKPLPESLQPEFLMKKFDSPDEITDVDKDSNGKDPRAFKTISEAASLLDVPQHVLRFWESRFAQIKPLKMAGGRRYYRPHDMEILSAIKNLLYKQGYTIKGAKKAFGMRKKTSAQPVDIFNQKMPPFPEVKQRVLTKKQQNQLSIIREELVGLRETLRELIY